MTMMFAMLFTDGFVTMCRDCVVVSLPELPVAQAVGRRRIRGASYRAWKIPQMAQAVGSDDSWGYGQAAQRGRLWGLPFSMSRLPKNGQGMPTSHAGIPGTIRSCRRSIPSQ